MHEKSTNNLALELWESYRWGFLYPLNWDGKSRAQSPSIRAVQRGGHGLQGLPEHWRTLGSGPTQTQAVLCMPGSATCSLYRTYKNVSKQSVLQGHTLTWELWQRTIDKMIYSIIFPIHCRGIHSIGLKSFCWSNANRNTRVRSLIFDSRFYCVSVKILLLKSWFVFKDLPWRNMATYIIH